MNPADAIDHTTSEFDEEPFDKVDAWFINPIRLLRDSRDKNCDGAFLAMSASLAMYERFLIKKAQAEGKHPKDDRNELGAVDLGMGDKDKFGIFWECMRDGLQHQFQPTKKRYGKTYFWSISSDHGKIPEVVEEEDKTFTVKVNPWEFAENVYSHYQKNPQLFEKAKSHKPGEVRSLEDDPPFQQASQSLEEEPVPLYRHHTESSNPTQPTYQKDSLQTGVFPATQKPKPLGGDQSNE